MSIWQIYQLKYIYFLLFFSHPSFFFHFHFYFLKLWQVHKISSILLQIVGAQDSMLNHTHVTQQISGTYSSCITKILYPSNNNSLFSPPQTLATTVLLCVSVSSAILDSTYKHNHAVFVLLQLANFALHNTLKVHPYCGLWQELLLIWRLNNCRSKLHFFMHSFISGHLGCLCILVIVIMLQWPWEWIYYKYIHLYINIHYIYI